VNNINNKSLKQFLLESNKAGYASGNIKNRIKEENGSTTIIFKKGNWKSDDNYFGGEPYGGRTVVFYKNKPVWLMIYYGWVKKGIKTEPVYQVLMNSLIKMPKENPYRGPKKHEENNFIYINNWEGEVTDFSGVEKITKNGNLVYKANYLGGLIDQRN
jgi:hypothetical protein